MPASNETQVPNAVAGSDQCVIFQAEQPVSSQVNFDFYIGNDGNNVLPQNMDVNEFENVANRNDSGFNTKILYGRLCHIKNVNPLHANFTIEYTMMSVLIMEILNHFIQQHNQLVSLPILQVIFTHVNKY